MIRSMTAFARRQTPTEYGLISWELRSVNHRFLEVHLRLPDEMRAMEAAVRERIGKRLHRGKVDCNLRFHPVPGKGVSLSLDRELVGYLAAALKEIDQLLGQSAPPSASELLRWPGVVQMTEANQEQVQKAALDVLDQALQEMVEARSREGSQLRELVLQRCEAVEQLVDQVRQRLPQVREAYREKLSNRVAEVKAELDPGRLEQEIALFAQKIDVDEELDRLSAHVAEARRTLQQGQAVGRRLDFLMQEFNREANTLGSKSVDVESTRAAVEMKVLIEQMREQIQNIE